MQLTIKNLNKAEAALIGMPVPLQQYGNVGKLVEDELESLGYIINRGAGCDLKELGVEIKTRTIEATSAQTICKMTELAIIHTPYDQSPVKTKFQQQFRVHHSVEQGCVVSAKMYEFRDAYFQDKARHAYETARTMIANGNCSDYVRGDKAVGYFEKTSSIGNSYDFRFPSNVMESFETTARSTFSTLFELV